MHIHTSAASANSVLVDGIPMDLPVSIPNDYDPFNPPFRDNPFPFYGRAREELPIFYNRDISMWIVTRYDDVSYVLKNANIFSSRHNFDPASPFESEVIEVLSKGYPDLLVLINSDPPDHGRFRQALSSALTGKRIALMESTIEEISNTLIDTFIHDNNADLVSQFNTYLPISVMGKMLGFPPGEIKAVHRMCSSIVKLLWWNISLKCKLAHAHNVVSLHHYLASQIERRRTEPQDDMLTALVNVKFHGEPSISTSELVSLTTLLLFATTGIVVKFLGNAQMLLLNYPEQLSEIRENSDLMPDFVEESIRMEPSLRAIVRTAKEPVEVGDVLIPEGARLLLHLASANRDEKHFSDPDSFNIHREDSTSGRKAMHKHLGLGHGIHYCAGAPLGRLICRTAIRVLLERLPNLRLQFDEKHEFEASLIYRGLQHLNVEWDLTLS